MWMVIVIFRKTYKTILEILILKEKENIIWIK
jgi:hypothetical protein